MAKKDAPSLIADNRKARHDFSTVFISVLMNRAIALIMSLSEHVNY